MGEKGLMQDEVTQEGLVTTQDGALPGGPALGDMVTDDADAQSAAGDLKRGDARPPMTRDEQEILINFLIEKTLYEYRQFVMKMSEIEKKELFEGIRRQIEEQENAKPPAKDEKDSDVQKVEGDLGDYKPHF